MALLDCNINHPARSCRRYEDAGVVCQGKLISMNFTISKEFNPNIYFLSAELSTEYANCSTGDVRINGTDDEQAGTREGRVELCVNNAWGTVCGDNVFGPVDAGVVCQQMGGFYREGATVVPGGETTSGPIFLELVDCSDTDNFLLDCGTFSNSLGLHSCDHTQDAHIRCFGKEMI